MDSRSPERAHRIRSTTSSSTSSRPNGSKNQKEIRRSEPRQRCGERILHQASARVNQRRKPRRPLTRRRNRSTPAHRKRIILEQTAERQSGQIHLSSKQVCGAEERLGASWVTPWFWQRKHGRYKRESRSTFQFSNSCEPRCACFFGGARSRAERNSSK